ncbi:MAG: SpoVG family protein [Oscillospiraceae bacterium]|jgi:putative septation protein spoVG|nr:SpoVG family protein [Oscillospiraceae bacterium]
MKVKAAINKIVYKPESTVKAYASVSFDGAFAVHGIKVCENEKGRFVSMPSMPYKDRNGETKYSDTFHPISKGAREALNQSVLNAYDFELQQIQAAEIEIDQSQEEAEEVKEYPEPELGM